MLTIFTVPKAFEGHNGIIQNNAVESWLKLPGEHEIILFGDDPGVAEVAERHDLLHRPEIARNERGTPLIGDVFTQACRLARNDLLCFVNADIILLDDFPTAVASVAAKRERFLLVGRRTDLDITAPLDFSGDWQSALRRRSASEGVLHGPHSTDFFAFRRNTFGDIPPFAIGRTSWDNWLMYEASRSGADLIDATEGLLTVHQNHDYGHVPNGHAGAWKGEESRKNLALAGGYSCVYSVYDASRLYRKGRLISARWPWYWGRRFIAAKNRMVAQWLFDHPAAHRLIRKIRGRELAAVDVL